MARTTRKPTQPAEDRAAAAQARRDAITQKLIEGVAAIQSSADFARWLTWASGFYRYSANNMLLIWIQRPDAALVAGYQRWQKLGRQVQKGAKGIMIIAPRVKKNEDPATPDSVYFGVAHVFDISDTDGDPMPELPAPDLTGDGHASAYAALVAYAEGEGLRVTDMPAMQTEAKGYYSRYDKTIYVEPAAPAQMLRVLAHELAHHEDRENKAGKDEKETIAEGAAHIICAHLGVDTSASTYPYIAGWASSDGGPQTIMRCMQRIQTISKRLIEATGTAEASADTDADADAITPPAARPQRQAA